MPYNNIKMNLKNIFFFKNYYFSVKQLLFKEKEQFFKDKIFLIHFYIIIRVVARKTVQKVLHFQQDCFLTFRSTLKLEKKNLQVKNIFFVYIFKLKVP